MRICFANMRNNGDICPRKENGKSLNIDDEPKIITTFILRRVMRLMKRHSQIAERCALSLVGGGIYCGYASDVELTEEIAEDILLRVSLP